MSDLQQRLRRAADTLRRTSMPLADLIPLLQQAADALEEQPTQLVPLRQILTDPENQPNQYGVEFLMRGPKFAFRVGNRQFTLDYEPTEPGEFEFMRDMLIHAFSIFTPDVKTAQAVPLLTDEEIDAIGHDAWVGYPSYDSEFKHIYRRLEQALRSKLGAGVGWQPIETAPRDGTNILLRFGQDGVSQGKYVPGAVVHPWKFIDTDDGITWLVNHAVDGPGGPSHWQPLPPPPGIVGKEK